MSIKRKNTHFIGRPLRICKCMFFLLEQKSHSKFSSVNMPLSLWCAVGLSHLLTSLQASAPSVWGSCPSLLESLGSSMSKHNTGQGSPWKLGILRLDDRRATGNQPEVGTCCLLFLLHPSSRQQALNFTFQPAFTTFELVVLENLTPPEKWGEIHGKEKGISQIRLHSKTA